ncbi:MAG TPA: LEA type 2 family protein [Bacteroidales bacterium]|nr:LEA type 2 family protein [Bacteroidales bacterium]
MIKIFCFPKIKLLAALATFTFLTSCDVVKQVSQVSNLSKCDFRLESVQRLTLAGVQIQNVKSISDVGMFDAAKLASAVASQQLPLNCILNVEAKNPNTADAGITKIDWILLIDDIEMTSGIIDQPVTIPANNGTAFIPVQVNVDLQKALSGKSADAIINFAMNLAGAGNKPTRFTMKMKPSISVGGFPVSYPGYVTIKTEYSNL